MRGCICSDIEQLSELMSKSAEIEVVLAYQFKAIESVSQILTEILICMYTFMLC